MKFVKSFGKFSMVALIVSMCVGCSSTKRLAVNMVGNALSKGGETWSSDEDPQLVREAMPFSLKLVESLLAESPKHEGLLFTAASGFTQYAYAFVQMDAERLEQTDFEKGLEMKARARKLFIRGRDYGLKGLNARHKGFEEAFRESPDAAILMTDKEDVRMLYWTAVAWAASISIDKTNMEAIGDLPYVSLLIDRALELDPEWDHGSLQSFMITFATSRQDLEMAPEEAARLYYSRALELSHGYQAGVHVALAESVAIPNQNKAEFKALMDKALEVDVNKRVEWRLLNILMQRRAQWLLSRQDELFF